MGTPHKFNLMVGRGLEWTKFNAIESLSALWASRIRSLNNLSLTSVSAHKEVAVCAFDRFCQKSIAYLARELGFINFSNLLHLSVKAFLIDMRLEPLLIRGNSCSLSRQDELFKEVEIIHFQLY